MSVYNLSRETDTVPKPDLSVRSAVDRVPNSCRVVTAGLFLGWDGQERGELIGGGDGEAGEGVFEPLPGVHAALLAGGGEARQDRQSSAARTGSSSATTTAADRERLHRAFGDIVVDGQSAVSDVDIERGPLVAGIGHRFAQGTLRQRGDGE